MGCQERNETNDLESNWKATRLFGRELIYSTYGFVATVILIGSTIFFLVYSPSTTGKPGPEPKLSGQVGTSIWEKGPSVL